MTITSNIYTNLAGWSNATYAVGDLRQNGTNAYVCSVPGTSTSPPTGTGTNIAPGGTSRWNYVSNVDYTTLQAWADAIPSAPSQPVVGIWDDGGGLLTYAFGSGLPLLWFQGHTTTGTNTITLQPRAGRGYRDKFAATPTTAYAYSSSNGLAISTPTSGTASLGLNLIQIDDNNVNLNGLQIIEANGSDNMSLIGGSGTNCHITQCIIDGISQSGGASLVDMTGAGFLFTNNLVIDRVPSGLTSATFKAYGTGTALANNAFICINNVSTMSAVDAGTNASAGSSTAINNIFVGYGANIFIAQTGFIWTTNNNSYTNPAFGTNGTDSGGSLYSITPSAVFVSPTTNFHIKTGSVVANAGSTDTTDIPNSVDFVGTIRPQGANWDMGPHELLAGSVILRDFIVPVDAKTSRVGDRTSPVEWNAGRQLPLNGSIAIEFRGSVVGGQIFPQEYLASWPLNAASSGFSSGFTSGFGPLNQIFTSNPALISPIEWSVSQGNIIRVATFPLEFGSRAQRDAQIFADWRCVVLFSGLFPVEWSSPIVTRDAAMSIDWGRIASRSIITPMDANAQSGRSSIFPAEWGGFTGIVVDGVLTVEFLTTENRSFAIPVDFRSPAVTTDASIFVDFLSTTQMQMVSGIENVTTRSISSILSVDWTAPIGVSATLPTEYGILVTRTSISYLEARSSVLLDAVDAFANSVTILSDASLPLAEGAGRQADASVPADFSATPVASGGFFPMFVEWRSTIQEDLVSGASSVSNVQETATLGLESLTGRMLDASIVLEWSLGVALSSVSYAEWGHLLITRNVDGIFQLEHKSVVVSDITMSIDLELGREAIGSLLTPDEWEFEHEP